MPSDITEASDMSHIERPWIEAVVKYLYKVKCKCYCKIEEL